MRVDGTAYRTIWPAADGPAVEIIDQTKLPHSFETARLTTLDDAAHAITAMQVRGAPLIGATAAYGLWLALRVDPSDASLNRACETLIATRPTAVNLRWAVEAVRAAVAGLPPGERADAAFAKAGEICDADAAMNRAIGEHGLALFRELHAAKGGGPLNVLTHCNAGWLATVDWGTALAPIYMAHDAGLPVHVWVDETRPRNQGAALTAWELGRHGVPHTVIADNAGGLLMRQGRVDLCITGTDRVTARGDVANKIGTYLKALAAQANGVPFHVALPGPTIDWSLADGDAIPIEERAGREVSHIPGRTDDGGIRDVRITPLDSPVANPAFDVTPANLVNGFVTERGRCAASAEGLAALYPEHASAAAE